MKQPARLFIRGLRVGGQKRSRKSRQLRKWTNEVSSIHCHLATMDNVMPKVYAKIILRSAICGLRNA